VPDLSASGDKSDLVVVDPHDPTVVADIWMVDGVEWAYDMTTMVVWGTTRRVEGFLEKELELPCMTKKNSNPTLGWNILVLGRSFLGTNLK
jgi:hypothetical protein